jgi:hypothetical protein
MVYHGLDPPSGNWGYGVINDRVNAFPITVYWRSYRVTDVKIQKIIDDVIGKEYGLPATTMVGRVQEFAIGNREVGTEIILPPGAVTFLGAQLQGNAGFGAGVNLVSGGNLYTPPKQGMIINEISCGAGTNLVSRPFGTNSLSPLDNGEKRKGKEQRYDFLTQLFGNTKTGLPECLKMQASLFPIAAQQMDGLPDAASHKYVPTEVPTATVSISRENTGNLPFRVGK